MTSNCLVSPDPIRDIILISRLTFEFSYCKNWVASEKSQDQKVEESENGSDISTFLKKGIIFDSWQSSSDELNFRYESMIQNKIWKKTVDDSEERECNEHLSPELNKLLEVEM